MTLRAQITADVSDVFLNEDDFAEECTYYPKGAGPRTITCVVDEDSNFPEDGEGSWRETVLRVFCSRSDTTGIDKPQIGEAFRREGTPEDQAFTYVGIAEDVDENAWTLLFTRQAPHKRGGNK